MRYLILILTIILLFLSINVFTYKNPKLRVTFSYDFNHDPDVNRFVLYRDYTLLRVVNRDECNQIGINGTKTILRFVYTCPDDCGGGYTLTALDEANQESDHSSMVYVPTAIRGLSVE